MTYTNRTLAQPLVVGASPATAVVLNVSDAKEVLAAIHTGGVAGGTITFECTTDGVNWMPIIGLLASAIPSAGAVSLGVAANAHVPYLFNVAGYIQIRFRVSSALGSAATIDLLTWNDASHALVSIAGGQLVVSSVTGTVTISGSTSDTLVPPAAGGASISKFNNPVVSNTPVQVKASAGRVLHARISNPNTTAVQVSLYDKASAPTIATDAIKDMFVLQAGQTITETVDFSPAYALGIYASATPVSAAASGLPANTAPALPVAVSLSYV